MIDIKKGSLTVEAAVIFPVFFFGIIALMNVLMWFLDVEKAQMDLINKARKLSMTAYTSDKLLDKAHMNVSEDITLFDKPHNVVIMRKFTGISDINGDENEDIVYITTHGSVYHRSNTCTYIKAQISEISFERLDYIKNSNNRKYIACNKCANVKSCMPGTVVYIAKYGTRYHMNSNCNAIEKNAFAIRISEVSGRKECSKCGKEGN